MSAEETVTEALNKPVDNNEAAAADAKKLLAELDAEGDAPAEALEEKTNGQDKDAAAGENGEDADANGNDEENGEHKHRDRDDRRGRGGGRGRGRGRGRGGSQRGGGIKSVLTKEEKSNDHDAIRKQVEFYFSDSNLPQDQFLLGKVGGSENHPVELSLIRTFKRMRHFEPLEAIVEALRTSKLVQLTDDDTKVQRKQPLAQANDEGVNHDQLRVYEDKAMPRSVYVKGFGAEIPSTQFDIEAWFAEFGTTNAVRLRRADDKMFKGSVFAEFETEEQAKAFLELDPKPKYKEKDMQIMSKKEYCEKKVEDIKAGKIKAGNDRSQGSRDNRQGRGGSRHNDRDRKRGGDDDRDWRTRRDEDRKNGFRDDKRRGGRDRRDGGNRDRERRRSDEKDDRGVPVIKTAPETEREKNKAEALAKAKAAVDNAENGTTEEPSKKREREEDTSAEEPATKKVDVKTDA